MVAVHRHLSVEERGPVALVRMDRPPVNAMDLELLAEGRTVLDELAAAEPGAGMKVRLPGASGRTRGQGWVAFAWDSVNRTRRVCGYAAAAVGASLYATSSVATVATSMRLWSAAANTK